MKDQNVSLEYYLEGETIWVELWEGRVHNARTLDDFYHDPQGRVLIDADIAACQAEGLCSCSRYRMGLFDTPLDWFKCVIRNNFAANDGVADSTHLGSFVTHIPESRCPENDRN